MITSIVIMVLFVLMSYLGFKTFNTCVSFTEDINLHITRYNICRSDYINLRDKLKNIVKEYYGNETDFYKTLTSVNKFYLRYPELRSNDFVNTNIELLINTEYNLIQLKNDYNERVREYNIFIKKFPNCFIVPMMSVKHYEYFSA